MAGKGREPGRPPRRAKVQNGEPLTIDLDEAAAHLRLTRRTLIGYLRKDGSALVELGGKRKVLRVDRKAFFRFCKRMGFESAVSHGR